MPEVRAFPKHHIPPTDCAYGTDIYFFTIRPSCYRAYGSTHPDSPNCEVPGFEDKKMDLVRHVSFVDCPGHDILMATMLNGAAVMDGALLLIAGNESCPQPQTSEHLAAVEIMRLKHIIILQNKIDLVQENAAANQYDAIVKFVQGTIADGAPVIPISAQLKYNIDVVCEYVLRFPNPTTLFTALFEYTTAVTFTGVLAAVTNTAQTRCFISQLVTVCPYIAIYRTPNSRLATDLSLFMFNRRYIIKKIPVPVRDFVSPCHMIVIRSFDVNKPGAEVDDIQGGVAGGSILQGVLRVGQQIEVRPGIVSKDAEGKIKCTPISSRIVSLFAEQNQLKFAVPGGLIGVGTTVDPTLTRADRLVGQVLGEGTYCISQIRLPVCPHETDTFFYSSQSASSRRCSRNSRLTSFCCAGTYFPFTTFRRLIAHTRLTFIFTISGCLVSGHRAAKSKARSRSSPKPRF